MTKSSIVEKPSLLRRCLGWGGALALAAGVSSVAQAQPSHPAESQAPSQTQAPETKFPEFSLLRRALPLAATVVLPQGGLKEKTGGLYVFEGPEALHVLQSKIMLGATKYEKPYLAIFNSFHDGPPPAPSRLFTPSYAESEAYLKEKFNKDPKFLEGAENFADCRSDEAPGQPGAQDPAHLQLQCLLRKLLEDNSSSATSTLVRTTIMLESGPAVLVFDTADLGPLVGRISALCSQEECPTIPAILVHDTETLKKINAEDLRNVRLGGAGGDQTDIYVNLAMRRSEIFRVVDLLHPLQLLRSLQNSQSVAQDALILRMRNLNQGVVPEVQSDAARIPASFAEFTRQALIFYAGRDGENEKEFLLKVDLRGPAETASLIERGGLSEAFLPKGGILLAAPAWLYDRAVSVALAAQDGNGNFCRGADGAILFHGSAFGALPSASARRVDEAKANNLARDRLYRSPCEASMEVKGPPFTLPARLASQHYGAVCGIERAGISEVEGIAGQYSLSPIIDPFWSATSGGPAAPFVLTDVKNGVYMQNRPVNLGEFAAYLTSGHGCRHFTRSGDHGGVASDFAYCTPRAQAGVRNIAYDLNPSLNPERANAGRRHLFDYFHGAVSAALTEVGVAPTGTACHALSTEPPAAGATGPAPKDLCALQFFFAARAADRLEGAPQPQTSGGASAGTSGDSAGIPLERLISSSGAAGAGTALDFSEFKGCNDAQARLLPAEAPALCTALQRYVRAAFSQTGGLWAERPVTMVFRSDAEDYVAWRVGDENHVTMKSTCEKQLGLPSSEELVQAAVADEEIRSLTPTMSGLMEQPGVGLSQGVYNAGLFASTRLLPKGPGLAMAGLPVGVGQIVHDTNETAKIPAFGESQPLRHGFGLSPRAVSTYFTELGQGGCMECRSTPEAFAWRVWPPKPPAWNAPSPGGDPVTGFRMRLGLSPQSATASGN